MIKILLMLGNLIDTMSKRKLSDKQLFKRKDINKKIINKFKQTSKAA